MKSKEEYIDDLAGQLKEWAGKIDELKVKASLAKAEAKDEYEKKINELKAKQDAAAKKLDELKNDKFFYGVGFARPHLPFSCPKKYWEMYPEDEIDLPPNFTKAVKAPEQSMHKFGELRNYTEVEYSDSTKEYLSNDYAKKLIRGYYATTTYVDVQIGRLVEKLRNTKDDMPPIINPQIVLKVLVQRFDSR